MKYIYFKQWLNSVWIIYIIEAVPRRILEKMNEKMNVPEISREKVASHLQVIIYIIYRRPLFITN